ncbi:glycosyltransferase family 4 protein [Aquimarina litoralis]|uniref:glycosyltransferase family 4 protein n=1 Tax=Aquimarina litoralis TaxID=584605 RepID=UPI001C58CCA8|nr:glycosyltransferase family 1 protein [Aquimarina litoralis]MBW1293902.1 glycosyltransferase [Aquimarina litoralis]
MNILIDAHIFNYPYQGSRTYLKELYSSLIPIAKDINFYFVADDIQILKEEFGEENKNVFFVQFASKNKFYRLAIDLPKIIKKYKIDFAHFQYISPLFKTCKEIVTMHDVLFNDFPEYFPNSYRIKNNILFKRSAKRADILLTDSIYSKTRISEHYNIEEDRIEFIPCGVSKRFFENSNIENIDDIKVKYKISNDYILYLSRIEPRKNHIALVRAFVELKLYDKGYNLVLIGKEDIKSKDLFDFVNELDKQIKESIIFISNVDNSEQEAFLKGAKLFVCPSFAEGFGIPPLEAIAVGTTTLCSNATAMADFTFFEENHFDPYNIQELKNKIERCLEFGDPDITKKVSYIKEHYNWDKIAQDYLQILRENSI